MKGFLETVVDFVQKSNISADKHLLVFPSARSLAAFESNYILNLKEAGWMSVTISYSDFVQHLSDYKRLSSSDIFIEFVESINNHFKNKGALHGVNSWGPLLLKDFDEIINQQVERKSFFENFKNLKAIEHWNPENRPESIASKYISFWDRAEEMFDVFESHCKKMKIGSNAFVLKNAIENISDGNCKDRFVKSGMGAPKSIHIVGFTALSLQEKQLLEQLRTTFEFNFWMDTIHPKLTGNPAFHFFNLNKDLFQSDFKTSINEEPFPQIEQFACPGNLEQVQTLFSLLENMAEEELSNTVVYLPDASLLPVLLFHQPHSKVRFNTGIGLPLRHLDSFKFVWQLLTLFGRNSGTDHISAHSFYRLILKNPIVEEIDFDEQSRKQDVDSYINQIYKHARERRVIQFLETIHSFVQHIVHTEFSAFLNDDLSCLALISEELSMSIEMFKEKKGIIDHLAPISIVKDSIKELELTIKGEKGKGVQILSALEGRGLDFENVFYLSFNEEHFSVTNTGFIPSDLRRSYNLPSVQDKNAVMSYHVYRSISRAKKIAINLQ